MEYNFSLYPQNFEPSGFVNGSNLIANSLMLFHPYAITNLSLTSDETLYMDIELYEVKLCQVQRDDYFERNRLKSILDSYYAERRIRMAPN